MKLSVIIPVYNVELYIEKCIRSIENQDVSKDDYEVLIYNDGTKDNSVAIIESLLPEYPNIRFTSHSNKGLSGTRNRGLREAQGDYIWFIDSDDWIEDNCLSDILNSLKPDTDVLSFSGFIPEGNRVERNVFYSNEVQSKEDLLYADFMDAAQFYIYRRQYLLDNYFFFAEGIKHEDVRFTPIVLYSAKNVAFHRNPVYHFLQREGSITTVVDFKRVIDLSETLEILYVFSKCIQEDKTLIGFYNHMAHHIIEMLNYCIDNGQKGEKFMKEVMTEHPEYWTIMRTAIDKKPRLIYNAIKFSPLPFVTTYKLLKKMKK